MVKDYLKIAWRNLVRNKTFSLINIVGLAIGLDDYKPNLGLCPVYILTE